MEYLISGITLVVIIVLLYFIAQRKDFQKNKTKHTKQKTKIGMVTCPLCGSPLQKGENLITRVYRPMTVPDQRCTISGCPHCYPVCESGVQRKCPVCGKVVPKNGYLIARLFNRTEGKKHVMITGCSECAKTQK